ncbi:MAG: zinc dependent phospholipase C family protein [Bacteroidota bacterium]
MRRIIYALGLSLLVFLPKGLHAWGFWAHQRINRLAVFTLPPEMFGIYKEQLEYLTEHAVDPDMRRYAVEGEAAHHYIDIDHYGSYPFPNVPRTWEKAVAAFTADTLEAYGVLPYHLPSVVYRLRDAFAAKDLTRIMKLSSDLGHYVGDAHVPLHTTLNYNGQLTGQKGIHGFWESRLPELFASDYDLFVGRAYYIEDLINEGWNTVLESHIAKDSVLLFEARLNDEYSSDKKFGYESRNQIVIRTYSRGYSQAYHKKLDGMVERRMRKAVRAIGSYWYTAWVMAGSPDLSELAGQSLGNQKTPFERRFKILDRESDAIGFNPVLAPILNPEHLCCTRPRKRYKAFGGLGSPHLKQAQSTAQAPFLASIWQWLSNLVD